MSDNELDSLGIPALELTPEPASKDEKGVGQPTHKSTKAAEKAEGKFGTSSTEAGRRKNAQRLWKSIAAESEKAVRAAVLYESRQDGLSIPEGERNDQGLWIPTDKEMSEAEREMVDEPSTESPDTWLNYCKSIHHCAETYDVSVDSVRIVRLIVSLIDLTIKDKAASTLHSQLAKALRSSLL
ncbi:TPA: hypothetical protein UL936_001932 [Stenotrophomonas maltophilia]|nr:hypothetical protein [Stenotrophomonas maltophilia]